MTVELERGLRLIASNPTEQRVLEHLEGNASAALTEKIAGGKKTLAGALNYARGEARELAGDASSLCVDDDTVFGWIIHYFEEDSIREAAKKPARKKSMAKKSKPAPAKKTRSKRVVEESFALELFSAAEMGPGA